MLILNEFIKKGIITEEQLFSIKTKIQNSDKFLDEILMEENISPLDIIKAKKVIFSDTDFREIDEYSSIPKNILKYIPIESAKRYKIIPLGISEDDYFEVGMVDPDDLIAKTTLQFISTKIGKPYRVFLISWGDYVSTLKKYDGAQAEVSRALGEYTSAKDAELKTLMKKKGITEDEEDVIREDAPMAKIVANIIKGAAKKKASDIHIEINSREILVRFRVDGVMEKNLVLPKNIHRAVVARVKIISGLKIDEKRKPQDGRFSGNFLNRKIDFRVSTFPTHYGEKVVMRLLEQDRGALPIDKIGFTDENMSKIKRIINNSYGIVLVCGPTGSGKTNTLYSLLNEIDKKVVNVVSLENPIELNIPGVSQSQVRPDIGYTFSTGLRAILRQDPDVIMVGEIRDEETASLAIEAALTGHLVLSTIHTNTAADVPQRLVDMGVAPYLIGPTLIASIGQRLVRKIVPEFKKEEEMNSEVKRFIDDKIQGLPESIQKEFTSKNIMYETESYGDEITMKGRTAVFEILEMNDKIKRIILTDPSSISIFAEARKTGFKTFVEDGILKALDGVTTFEEIMKL